MFGRKRKPKTPTLDGAVVTWRSELEAVNRSEQTLRQYRDCLGLFAEHRNGSRRRNGDRRLGDFDRQSIVVFFSGIDGLRLKVSRDTNLRRKERPVSAITRHAYARSIRAFFRWACEAGLVPAVVKVPMPKVPKKEAPRMGKPEMESIIQRAVMEFAVTGSLTSERFYVLVLLLRYTGFRRSELNALEVRDIDLEADPPSILIRHGKGDKARRIPIHNDLLAPLRNYREALCAAGQKYLMWSGIRPGRPLHKDALSRLLPQQASCHRWRHAFASDLCDAGANLIVVKNLLGHESVSTTERYCRTQPVAMAAALNRALGEGGGHD